MLRPNKKEDQPKKLFNFKKIKSFCKFDDNTPQMQFCLVILAICFLISLIMILSIPVSYLTTGLYNDAAPPKKAGRNSLDYSAYQSTIKGYYEPIGGYVNKHPKEKVVFSGVEFYVPKKWDKEEIEDGFIWTCDDYEGVYIKVYKCDAPGVPEGPKEIYKYLEDYYFKHLRPDDFKDNEHIKLENGDSRGYLEFRCNDVYSYEHMAAVFLVDDSLVCLQAQRADFIDIDDETLLYNCIVDACKEGLDIHNSYLTGGTTDEEEKKPAIADKPKEEANPADIEKTLQQLDVMSEFDSDDRFSFIYNHPEIWSKMLGGSSVWRYRCASGYAEDMAEGEYESDEWFNDYYDFMDYWTICHKKMNACP